MHGLAYHLYLFFARLDAGGLVLLGILDSSFLMLPLGNDLLLIGLTSQHPHRLWMYIPAAACGSTLGVLALDLVLRKGGEEGLKNRMSPKRLEYLKRKITNNSALAVSIAALAPPPFPFTPVVAAASAFSYPRWKLLTTIFVTRIVRFSIIGALAIWQGQRLIAMAKTPLFQGIMVGFIVLCIVGSAWSIYTWTRRRPA